MSKAKPEHTHQLIGTANELYMMTVQLCGVFDAKSTQRRVGVN